MGVTWDLGSDSLYTCLVPLRAGAVSWSISHFTLFFIHTPLLRFTHQSDVIPPVDGLFTGHGDWTIFWMAMYFSDKRLT